MKTSRDITKLVPGEVVQLQHQLKDVLVLLRKNDVDTEVLAPAIKNLEPENVQETYRRIKEYISTRGGEAGVILSVLLKEPFTKDPHQPWSPERTKYIEQLTETGRTTQESQQESLYLRNLLRGKGSRPIKYAVADFLRIVAAKL